MTPADYITTAEAARICRVTQRTIERMITSGKLPAKVLDRKAKRVTYIISRADLDNLAKRKK